MNQPTEQKVKEWYNKHHRSFGENSWRPPKAYSIFLDLLNVQPNHKLLDIGCGTGHLLSKASQRGLETFGVDISEEAINISCQQSPNSIIKVAKAEELPFPDSFFDYIFCLGSLEHFLDMKKALKEMKRVAKENTCFCVMVPNKNYLYWKLKRSKGTQQQKINEHLLTLERWTKLLEEEGFNVLNILKDQWPFERVDIFSSLNPFGVIKRTALKLLGLTIPLHYSYQFIFILNFSKTKKNMV